MVNIQLLDVILENFKRAIRHTAAAEKEQGGERERIGGEWITLPPKSVHMDLFVCKMASTIHVGRQVN